MVYKYKGMTSSIFWMVNAGIVLFLTLISMKMIPLSIISVLFTCSQLFYCLGKYFTIRDILKMKYAGSVSSITAFFSFMGIFGRLMTLIVEIGREDPLLLSIMSTMMLFSGGVFVLSVLYREAPVEKKNK